MNLGGAGRPLAVVIVSAFLGGCITPGSASDTFDDVPVPVWEAGYEWSYDVTTTSRESYNDGRGTQTHQESRTDPVIITVFNTTAPFGDRAAYYVRQSGVMDHPTLGSHYQALAQDDLSLIGLAWGWYGADHPVAVAHPDMYYLEEPARPDPCAGRPQMEEAAADEAPPAVTFPLQAGAARSGVWGEDGFGMAYRYAVRSMESVQTPAGTFDAVHVAITLIPQRGQADFAPDGFRATFDHWYAPDVRQVVRSEIVAKADDFFGEGSFEYSAVQELTSFDLTAGAEEPAPVKRVDAYDLPYVWREIVADQDLPVNIADGPAEVTFALRDEDGMGKPHRSYGGAIEQADPLPESLDVDLGKFQVAWHVREVYSGKIVGQGTGLQFPFTFERGGQYQVNAELQPLECGLPWLGSYAGTASTYWEKTIEFTTSSQLDALPGVNPPGQHEVLEFPVEWGALGGHAYWTASSAVPVGEGRPRIYDPRGYDAGAWEAGYGHVVFSPFEAGTWTAAWEPPGQVAVAPEDVTLTIRIDYFDEEVYRH